MGALAVPVAASAAPIATPGFICAGEPATIVPKEPAADNKDITGTPTNDVIYAGGGDDVVQGGGGNDKICGGGGDDYLYGGSGEDSIHGQEERDSVFCQSRYDRWLDVEDANTRGGFLI